MTLVIWAPRVSDEFVTLALIVVGVAVNLLHALIPHLLEDLSYLLLLCTQALHQLQTEIAFLMKDLGSFPFALIDDVWFCAGKRGSNDDLRPLEEACDIEVVAVKEPAPW